MHLWVLLSLVVSAFSLGGFETRTPDGVRAELTYVNQSVILTYDDPNSVATCPGSEHPLTIKQNLTSEECPKYLIGLNKDEPECNLDVKGEICTDNLQVAGTLSQGACDISGRVCQVPLNVLVPLSSVLSPAVDQADYNIASEPIHAGAQFGTSVDVNSTFVLSGSPLGVSLLWPSLVTGAAYIFQSYTSFVNTSFSSVRWTQTQSLSPFATSTSDEVEDSHFGTDVKLLCGSDNSLQFAASGAPCSRIGGADRGAVYVFRNVGSVINIGGNNFPLVDPLQRVESPSPRNGAFFGKTVEFGLFRDGTTKHLFVGAPGDRDVNNQNSAGCVYWFQWNNANSAWEGGTKISCIFTGSSSTTKDSKCGSSIAFAQDPDGLAILAVGAPEYKQSGGSSGAGSVTLFQWNPNTLLWEQMGGMIPDTGDSFYGTDFHFGFALSLSGNARWLYVGVPGADFNNTFEVGLTVVYEQISTNSSSYTQYRQPISMPLELEEPGTPDQFGYALASNWDSDWLMVCAPGYGLTAVPNSGICFKFIYSETTGYWNDTYLTIEGEESQSNSLFGYSVAMDYTQVVAGSPAYSIGPIDNGIISVNYGVTSLTYIRNTTCIQERGVLMNVVSMYCSFILLKNIPAGFYKVTTNTSILQIPATLISFAMFDFSDTGRTHLDAYYSVKYFSPVIPEEDIFVFYILSRTHTAVTINLIAKLYLGI